MALSEPPSGGWLASPDYLAVRRKSRMLAAFWIAATVACRTAQIGAVTGPGCLLLWWAWQWARHEEQPSFGIIVTGALGVFVLCGAVAALAAALRSHVRKRAGSYAWSS